MSEKIVRLSRHIPPDILTYYKNNGLLPRGCQGPFAEAVIWFASKETRGLKTVSASENAARRELLRELVRQRRRKEGSVFNAGWQAFRRDRVSI